MSHRHLDVILSTGCIYHGGRNCLFSTPWYTQHPMQYLAQIFKRCWLDEGWSSKAKHITFHLEKVHLWAALFVIDFIIVVVKLILHLSPSHVLLVNKCYLSYPSNISWIHDLLFTITHCPKLVFFCTLCYLLLPNLKSAMVPYCLQQKLSLAFKGPPLASIILLYVSSISLLCVSYSHQAGLLLVHQNYSGFTCS